MNFLVNGAEMKACDRYTIERYHVPSMILMEHAASALVEELLKCGCDMRHTGIICGYGNNGGDGLAAARILHDAGYETEVWMIGNEEHATEQTRQQLDMVKSYGITLHLPGEEMNLAECTLLVDAIFGVGLSREVTGNYAGAIDRINSAGVFTVAVDIPSGIHAGDGQVLGCAVRADITITFAFCKAGLVLYPGADYAGRVVLKKIGIGAGGMGGCSGLFSCELDDIRAMLPVRYNRSNKGTYGKAVLVVGSRGMAGAAYLAGIAAYRAGCGLVRIVTPEENRTIIQQLLPEAVLTVYDAENPDLKEVRKALEWGDCIGIGSGLGQSETADRLLGEVLKLKHRPVVIDGDGLRLLTGRLKEPVGENRNLTVTPHLGEMSGMTGITIGDIRQKLVQTAQQFAERYKVCCVLKDARTVVTDGGKQAYINMTGNHGMATGGSGDVLAGMLCGLLAGGMDRYKASIAAVYLHGRAGDLAAETTGARGMTAKDIADCIPQAVR